MSLVECFIEDTKLKKHHRYIQCYYIHRLSRSCTTQVQKERFFEKKKKKLSSQTNHMNLIVEKKIICPSKGFNLYSLWSSSKRF
jgi:hypothetical protein